MSAGRLLRTFVAVSSPCPPALARLIREFAQLGSAVRACTPRGLHCTLRFLGDTSPETADRLGPAITAAIADLPSFPVELTGIGAFPTPERPSVVWAGLNAPMLDTLFERVDAVAADFGYPADRLPFKPHVTLARVKDRPPPRLAELMQQHAETGWGAFEVTAVELFQSTLTPAGPRYDVLSRAPLRSSSSRG